ncbi:MAG: GNAT family N-acetyltransferase [Proteobacteria bacterium]|nr:GNAT family N-acetyltransferase [Pseudomonadota bacterium]
MDHPECSGRPAHAPARFQLFPMTRSIDHMRALEAMAATWQQGAERFWDFEALIAMLARPICRGYYAAVSSAAPWVGVMFIDVGVYAADLLYIYVVPEYRGRGAAGLMLQTVLTELATEPQLEALVLEVRPSNKSACKLYQRLGFAEVGIRKRYYSDGEDALVLKLPLGDADFIAADPRKGPKS